MIVRSSACLGTEYDSIAELCSAENEPVFFTDDGQNGFVTMSIEAYNYREEMLDLREKLLEAEAYRLAGGKTYSLEEVTRRMEDIINGSAE